MCREVISTSKPIKDVAIAYGVGPEILRNCLIKYREASGGADTELSVSERVRLTELERENRELRAETAFLEKPALDSLKEAAVASEYEYIESQKHDPKNVHSVVKICVWLAVSTFDFYHRAEPPAVGHRGP